MELDEPGSSAQNDDTNPEYSNNDGAGDGITAVKLHNNDEVDGKSSSNKLKDDVRFRYGNYNRYYGKRVRGLNHDPRLDLLDANWFRNQAVLDIGCNVGALTLSVAKAYAPRRVLGIDIDAHLIGVARKNIRHYCDAGETIIGKFPAALAPAKTKRAADDGSGEAKVRKFPHNVWFQRENYVLDDDYLLEMVRPEFDVILALSVTKWIHLNWGDAGMRRFFQRAYRQLRPGGRFIVEPQAFATYSRRRKMADEMDAHYRSIKFKPEQFTDYLLSDEVGFESVETLDAPLAKTKGFERPIFVYRKAVVRETDVDGKLSARKRRRVRRPKEKEETTDGDGNTSPAAEAVIDVKTAQNGDEKNGHAESST